MRSLSLSHKLALSFTLLMVIGCAVSVWLQMHTSKNYSRATIQQLSVGLASHIAGAIPLMRSQGLDQQALKALFDQTMTVNPSVEVYLLDNQGRIVADAAPPGRIKRHQVSLAPLLAMQQGAELPILGDDPRSMEGKKVFSAAPLVRNNRQQGWLYVILLGEDYQFLADNAQRSALLFYSLSSMGVLLLLTLTIGIVIFRWVTRPMRQLIHQVSQLDKGGMVAIKALAEQDVPVATPNEVSQLQHAFIGLSRRITRQWEQLAGQDQQRREFIANISHDLRTPLTSLHGYLETLSFKADSLTAVERQRYLAIALAQSQKVGVMAQQLFELARLEHGGVRLRKERFSLSELAQDVWQKCELSAERRQIQLQPEIEPRLPLVYADLSMIERVLTNLLDNAIRHSPPGGSVRLSIQQQSQGLRVELADEGPGVADELKATLFHRPSVLNHNQRQHGGLGLMIVHRMLQLHHSEIQLVETPTGACFRFVLPLE
ncbi:ATP-binding protein [Pantoea sp. 1.19]|uniref:sensor histidine kinase n=1 Tax=Pantoea sp. 1.19 TaxID=1925589 RepID=UPI000948CB1F|nr:ATP-binding protein [Pantoea sp. 1.19]